jgi:hypothetical protein
MLKPRSGLVLSLSSLFFALVASNCTVNSTDTDDDDDDGNGCIEGRTTACNCDDGAEGSQECTSRGTWADCVCEDGSSGSGGTGGSGGSAGKGGTSGSGTGGSYAGEAGYGGWTATTGGTGGAHVGGEGGVAPEAGGAPGLCEEPDGACQACYFGQCCTELEACLGDEVCVNQFVAMRECSNVVIAQHDATPADIDACAPEPNGTNHWPGNHDPKMIALVDCMNGGVGWENASTWPHSTCLDCYKEVGTTTGEGGAGGQGGQGPIAPGAACEEPEGSCQECYFGQCCAQFEACLGNPTCVDQFVAMRTCSNEVVSSHGTASPADVDACAPAPNGSNHWPGNHEPEMISLIDCVNGGVGWENAASWPHGTCLSCYQSE